MNKQNFRPKSPKKYDPMEDPNVQPGQDNPRNPQDDESTKKSLWV